MAIRRVYYILNNKVKEENFEIFWQKGISIIQKQKNIIELHRKISKKFNVSINSILEVSTKSPTGIGKKLSSFNLKINLNGTLYYLESVYQSSKVFKDLLGEIQFKDIINSNPKDAKNTLSKVDHTKLIKFNCFNREFSLTPTYLFYDWLYINAIKNIPNLFASLKKYSYFTDIEFSPLKSKNCQARTLTLFMWLNLNSKLEDYLINPFKYYRNIKNNN